MDDLKFCKDCRHMSPDYYCLRAPIVGLRADLVTGDTSMSLYRSCRRQRTYTTACGPDARDFEPKTA